MFKSFEWSYHTDRHQYYNDFSTRNDLYALIDECLALLFVVYIDPAFGVYLLERVDELLSGGFTVSDTWLVQAAGLRFTKEELTQILEQHETQHI